jgi:DNA processing protein
LLPEEQTVCDLLKDKDSLHTDELLYQSGLGSPQLAAVLLQLEMYGLVKALPGKHYRLD